MIKVLVADDHAVVRRGLKQILLESFEGAEISEAENGNAVLKLVQDQSFDVIILDISMPHKTGLDLLKDLKQDCPGVPVLVLSFYPEDQYGIRVLKAGAMGYMNKESAPGELILAVKKLLGGGKYVSPTLGENLAIRLGPEAARPPHDSLSDREFTVMRMMASGKSQTEIAKDLVLSPKTVSTYRSRILDKMKMRSTAEIIRYAILNRLTD